MEIEAKFNIPDEQIFEQLLQADVWCGFSLGRPTTASFVDHYLDNATNSSQAAGYACRLRVYDDSRVIATLKERGSGHGSVHQRIEYEVALPVVLPPQDWPPSAARELAIGLFGHGALQELFTLEQTRITRPLLDRDQSIAEVCLDHARLCHDNLEIDSFFELEIEAPTNASLKEIQHLLAWLQTDIGLPPQSQSKFERGMLAAHNHAPLEWQISAVKSSQDAQIPISDTGSPGITPDDPMCEAGRKTFRFHFRRMLRHEPGTRRGEDIEDLHDMRVATRRMRSAFRVFGRFYEGKSIKAHRKGLKRTGSVLGRVRDLDVFRAKTQAYQRCLPTAQQEDLNEFLSVLEDHRDQARQAMLAHLDSEHYHQFVTGFGAFVGTRGMGCRSTMIRNAEAKPYLVHHVAPVVIHERYAAVRAYDEWVTIPQPPLSRLHALRIACKRLRYTLEFFREVLAPCTDNAIEEIIALQDHLGDLQDAVVARDILNQYLERGSWGELLGAPPSPPRAPVESPGARTYLAAKEAELAHLVETFPQQWALITRPDFHQMLADVIAVL